MSILKALRAGKAVFVDARAVEAVLAPREISARPRRIGARQGASEVSVISVDRGRISRVEAASKKNEAQHPPIQ
jgi:hypothetical protein